jgi:hypothetical protein
MFESKKDNKRKKLTEDDLVTMIDSHLSTSNTYSTKINQERSLALKYFNSQPYGNEKKGRSSYVSSEVLETISWALPQIIKVFETNDGIVKLDPISPETVEAAEKATQYCEYVFRKQNPGFQVLYNFIFDCLLQKNGVVKIFYDNTKEYIREDYHDLTDIEAEQLLSQDDIEPIERETTEVEVEVPTVDPMTGQPMIVKQTQRTHNIAIKRVKNAGKGKIRVENVPPEELIVSRLARTLNLDDAPFIAHKVRKTLSWLRSQGFDVPDDISDSEAETTNYSPEKLVRQQLDGSYFTGTDETPIDPSQRLVNVVEAYMQVDWDGDGIVEWRKITKIGKHVLDNEECYNQPFVSSSPMPVPHKFYGMSLADLVMDLQYLKSLLMRAMLDSFAFNINPAKAINVNNVVDINDLLDTNPGNWIRLRGDAPNSIMALPSSGVGAEAFQLLEYVDNVSESRSGVSRYTQGIDSNAFNKTATGTQAIMNASQEKIALITRIIAETGLAEIYKKILRIAATFITDDQLIKTGDTFLQVNPKQWLNLETLSVNVGTGALDKQADAMQAQQILQMQTQLLQAGRPDLVAMVDAEKVFNAGSTILKSMGKKNVQDFFNDPQSQQYQQNMQIIMQSQPQPQPDPVVVATQITAQQAAEKAKLDAMIKSAQFEADINNNEREYELKKAELELKYGIEQEKLRQAGITQNADLLTQGIASITGIDGNQQLVPQDVVTQIHQQGFANQAQTNAAIAEALSNMGQGLQQVMKNLSSPKQIIRDEKGNVVGVQSLQQ